jgi:hypothetical protein
MCDIASGEGAAFCNEQVSMKSIDLLLRKQVVLFNVCIT